ncbi:MAG: glycine--tRNA ligase subunit beta [Candidatus Polarisedimenticolaceae bacterium]|nr:glycine--tRNA ligase subunit beta [Candidatus Polarisedimenticolaceae bacterium]
MVKQDLLIEIGTEELPPKALERLSIAFQSSVASQITQAGLGFESIQRFATPRRLALLITQLDTAQADRAVERKGPALKAAFDQAGNATRAAEGFARSCGVAVSELEQVDTPKGVWLLFRQTQPGQQTETLVPAMVEQALARLPIPKRMRWGSGDAEFVRPVHWVVMLFGNQIIDCDIMGLTAGRTTRGHRFHHPDPIVLETPASYAETLLDPGYVIADMDARREKIRTAVEQIAAEAGRIATIDSSLLDEVTALNEWPVAVMGAFDERFLEVPSEALIKAMQEHQKYFPVVDNAGRLQPCFITISNIQSQDPAEVRAGNERVIRPRFSDAAFFWEQDLKQPLDALIPRLQTVVFQKSLGSLHDKSQRISQLAQQIAGQLGFDPAEAARAAELSKCDLLSNMVGEFPSLQGVMGRHYAQHAGEGGDIAAAIEEQYLPRHAGDRLPQTNCGRAIAIADRLDTLVGIFAIGQKPTGEKDPFGLRRAALGVLRILIETPLPLDLEALLQAAATGLADKRDTRNTANDVFNYMMERLNAYYADRGFSADLIEAVLARRPTRPADFDRRVRAVAHFRQLPEAEALAAANKRIANILRKTDEAIPTQVDIHLLVEHSEKALAERVAELEPAVEPLLAAGLYSEVLQKLAALREPVDLFFDGVMVMCDDDGLRRNRLALLSSLSAMFLNVADISRLQAGSSQSVSAH